MERSFLIVMGLYCAFAIAGCVGVMGGMQPSFVSAGPGLLYTDVEAGSLVLDNGVKPGKSGQACSVQVLGLFTTGDTRVETAMNSGAITKITFVTQSIRSYLLGIYSEVCTVVKGN